MTSRHSQTRGLDTGPPKATPATERLLDTEDPLAVDRRTALALMGSWMSVAGLAACRRPVETVVPYVKAPEDVIPGVPLHYATSMPFGTSALGLVVETHEGRPTKIEGNPLHPSSKGRSSGWAQASILDLYDPDRSRLPRQGEDRSSVTAFAAAWKELHAEHLWDDGEGLAVLSGPFSSPTLARLHRAYREAMPSALWATHAPAGDENRRAGAAIATGRRLAEVLHLDRAEVIVSLDADVLMTDGDAVRQAAGFASGRQPRTASDTMSRLYAIESTVTPTGAVADHRIPLASGRIGAFVAALGQAVQHLGGQVGLAATAPEAPPVDAAILEAIARDLLAHRGSGLVLAGAGQPPEVHAAVLSLNAALGNLGSTVTLHETPDAVGSSRTDLEALISAMRDGDVKTLVVLDANPAYDAPADLDFVAALENVTTVVHFGAHLDETARVATWHVPRSHFLESWGDTRATDGTAAVVQPLIQPLFESRSPVEMLSLVVTGEDKPGYDLVRETWTTLLGEADGERRWRRVLHDGLLVGSETRPSRPTVRMQPLVDLANASGTADEGFELALVPSATVYDGRFANNAWMQELPEPITKITWDNVARIAPVTAASLGIATGDVLRLAVGERAIEVPAYLLPGQAERTITVELGYGRTAGGRIGTGVGTNAYALGTIAAPAFTAGLTVTRTGARRELATTQKHDSMEGRPIALETTLASYRERPDVIAKAVTQHPPLESLWKEHAYDEGPQWGMSIDLSTCTGCNACVVACQAENNVPVVGRDEVIRGREMHWIRIDRYFADDGDGVAIQPVTCMHCENAPCEQVCPVAATVHDDEGLNTMVYNRCIGTRYCANNCPYKVRRFNFYNFTKDTPELLQMAQNPDVTVRARGVMEKCTYCTQRINKGKLDAKLEGRELADGDVRTACQQACPTGAIVFGDITDPKSEVTAAKQIDRGYALLGELNTKPRTTYLARLRNPNPELR